MGIRSRPKPLRLAEKLLQIRLSLDLSQNRMLEHLGLDESHFRSVVSGYELGTREPPLPVLLKYARSVGVSTDVLIDDEMSLPQTVLRDAARSQTASNSAARSKRKRAI